MALTGALAANGMGALLAMHIATDEINARGGLLGRPIKRSTMKTNPTPSFVPNLYTKLLDLDKVDIVCSGYGPNMIAPTMPVVMQKDPDTLRYLRLGREREFR